MNFFLLQITNESKNNLIFYAILILVIIICIFVTRFIFSIDKFLKYQKAQTILLMRIAKNNGLTDSENNKLKELIDPNQTGLMQEIKTKELLKEL